MKIKLKKDIYKLEAIKEACKKYQEAGIAEFKCKKKEDEVVVVIDKINDVDKSILRDEFLNYLISEMKDYL